jgi:pentapeptide MXKDX repeat protein
MGIRDRTDAQPALISHEGIEAKSVGAPNLHSEDSMMRCKSKLAAMALSATLVIHVGIASAADDMKKDTMGKDAAKSGMMKKDAMASDCPDGSAAMPKDAMKQDSMAQSAMAGDAMKKSAKDCTDAAMKKSGQDAMKGGAPKQDAMGKDAMKK